METLFEQFLLVSACFAVFGGVFFVLLTIAKIFFSITGKEIEEKIKTAIVNYLSESPEDDDE